LRDYEELKKSDGIAPRGWKFDPNDFWIEEHGKYGEVEILTSFDMCSTQYLFHR